MAFYRAVKFWSIENFGVCPDIIVFGKALTNGLNPLSGVWARESLISPDVFPPGSTHSTFASNTLGTAVALQTVPPMAEHHHESTPRPKGGDLPAPAKDLPRRDPEGNGHTH